MSTNWEDLLDPPEEAAVEDTRSLIPSIGTVIYVPPGDWESGGRAMITEVKQGVSGGEPATFVVVREHPGCEYNWYFLEQHQERLKKNYGQLWATSSGQ